MEEKSGFWEKSVEWAFVRNHLPQTIVAAPLDGSHELSDALLGDESRWLLIEFKRRKQDCTSEKKKYPQLSRKLAQVIVRRDYEAFEEKFAKCFVEPRPVDWWDMVLDGESFIYPENGPPQLPGPATFATARDELRSLVGDYREQKWDAPVDKEPHYLVFSDPQEPAKLMALPYWSDWYGRKTIASRGVEPFIADEIWENKGTFSAFNKYALRLAKARGYPSGAITDDGGDENSSAISLVFGHVIGQAMSNAGEWIVMTLREFYEIRPQLVAKLEAKSSKFGM
ncbi:hypothetical protein [Burkholderia cepacia]|uniref:hypothetical protein n=1 Tax=Burkholderia cepacia TaxID=292 RepID=UPI000AD4570C|nr:hypothetical protein [Burkholderia cepacia]